MGKSRDFFKKIGDNKGPSDAKMSKIKEINGIYLSTLISYVMFFQLNWSTGTKVFFKMKKKDRSYHYSHIQIICSSSAPTLQKYKSLSYTLTLYKFKRFTLGEIWRNFKFQKNKQKWHKIYRQTQPLKAWTQHTFLTGNQTLRFLKDVFAIHGLRRKHYLCLFHWAKKRLCEFAD